MIALLAVKTCGPSVREDLWTIRDETNQSTFVCFYIPPNATDDVYFCFFRKDQSIIDSTGSVVVIIVELNLKPKFMSPSILSYFYYFTLACNPRDE